MWRRERGHLDLLPELRRHHRLGVGERADRRRPTGRDALPTARAGALRTCASIGAGIAVPDVPPAIETPPPEAPPTPPTGSPAPPMASPSPTASPAAPPTFAPPGVPSPAAPIPARRAVASGSRRPAPAPVVDEPPPPAPAPAPADLGSPPAPTVADPVAAFPRRHRQLRRRRPGIGAVPSAPVSRASASRPAGPTAAAHLSLSPAPVAADRLRRLVARNSPVRPVEPSRRRARRRPSRPRRSPGRAGGPGGRGTSPHPTPAAPLTVVPAPARTGTPTPALSLPSTGTLAAAIQIAERSGRTDLSAALRASREQIRRTGVTVAVVGEFKKGKSNLVNALVNAEVCPSDPVYATVVPIAVGHAEELTVTTIERTAEPTPQPATWPRSPTSAARPATSANHLGVARVEIGAPPAAARRRARRRRHAGRRRARLGRRRAEPGHASSTSTACCSSPTAARS